MNYKLAVNLVPFLIMIFFGVNFVEAAANSTFKVFETKRGLLGISTSPNNLVDLFYKRDGFEFRQFNNLDSKVSFLSFSKNQTWMTIGVLQFRKTRQQIYTIFSGKESYRSASNFDFCDGKDFASHFLKKTEEISKILDVYEEEKFENYFDEKSCSGLQGKGKIVNLIKQSIEKTNGDFKDCLNDNTAVANKLQDPDFRRIMFTYYVNLYDFYKGFVDEKKVFRISCVDEKGISKIIPGGPKPFSISMSKEFISDIGNYEKMSAFSSRFSGLLVHELGHVFTKIPSVPNVQKCEHEYQDFVAVHCKSGIAQDFEEQKKKSKMPICYAEDKKVDVLGDDEQTNPALIAERKKRTGDAQSGGVEATPQSGMGQAPSTETSVAPRAQLSETETTAVRRTADSLFGPAQSGNSDIEHYANQIFASSNPTYQQRAAEQVAARVDTQLDNLAKSAATLQAALGNTAVAATLPAIANSNSNPTVSRTFATTGSGGGVQAASAGNAIWTPTQALNTYITGNPNSVTADTSVSSTKLAGKISNTGGVSAMAAGGAASRSNAVTNSGATAVAGGTITVKMGAVAATSFTGQAANGEAAPQGRPNYELEGQSSNVQDTPTLRMLSSSATNISGNLYKAITQDYKSEAFVRGLKDRHILIRVLDPKTGKIKTSYGMQASPEGQSRQPSSIGSAGKTKKESQPEIIFEDNGTSLRKKDN